jgi:hypothetical protein
MMKKQLSKAEHDRAVEISFSRMVVNLVEKYGSPGAVVQVFIALSVLLGANAQTIQRLTLQVLEDGRLLPHRLAEELTLLYNSGVSVRQLMAMYSIGQSTIYKYLGKPYQMRYQFAKEDRIELVRFFTVLRTFRDEVL